MAEKPTKSTPSKLDLIVNQLLSNKYVLNKYETIDYAVQTGSISLDAMTGGGFHPGIIRFVGQSMGGKTSEAFQVMQNVFDTRPKSRGVYIKTERLTAKTQKRIGVKTVLKAEDWKNHTCLMIECHIYDLVSQFIIDAIYNNIELPEEEREQFVFIVDSLDFLMLERDMVKETKDAGTVAGPQVITKKLLTKIILPVAKFGHLCILTSQATAQPRIDPYAKIIPRVAGDVSGGNAAIHAADHILEFMPRNQGDLILENPALKPDGKTNKTLGHFVKVIFRKSDNEKYGQMVRYPIKYNQSNGESIWIEREIVDKAVEFGLISKKGAWFEIPESFKNELKDDSLPAQVQGMNKLYTLFEENKPLRDFFYKKLMRVISEDDVIVETEI